MSADKNDHSPESHETDHLGHEGHNHGSFKSYMIGFVLSVILTASLPLLPSGTSMPFCRM